MALKECYLTYACTHVVKKLAKRQVYDNINMWLMHIKFAHYIACPDYYTFLLHDAVIIIMIYNQFDNSNAHR